MWLGGVSVDVGQSVACRPRRGAEDTHSHGDFGCLYKLFRPFFVLMDRSGDSDMAAATESPVEAVPTSVSRRVESSVTEVPVVVRPEHRSFDSRVVPEYSGGRHVAEWYDRFRSLCERRGVDFVSVLPERLTGAAYATWAGLSPEEQASAASVRAALLDAYMPSWTDAFDEFQARRLQPGETVEEYLQELRGLAALFIDGPVPDSLLDAKFVSGLPEEARLRMRVGTRAERLGLREMLRVARSVGVTAMEEPPVLGTTAAGRQRPPPSGRRRTTSPPAQEERQIQPRRCWTCGRPGHIAAVCRQRVAPVAPAEGPNGHVAAQARARSHDQ